MTLGSRLRDERGVAMVLFAVILPLTFILAAATWDVGNWWVHRKHLQTKVDAAAFAGGGVWNFPCGDAVTGNSATIEATARKFFGPHTTAAGTILTAGYNPQVGGAAPAQDVHVVLNGMDWYDNDTGLAPADRLSPPNPSICDSKTLDVKATEDDTDALFGWLPFFPDIKRKARVQIEEAAGLSGLLPIGVRIPRPLSAAVVFYEEKPGATYGEILDVKYLCETNSIFGLPPGLGGWTSLNTTDPACSFTSWATFHPRISNGVAIAVSFKPRCGAGTPPAVQPCLNVNPSQRGTQINDFCGQASGLVECFFADGAGATQTINSGLHFIRGYTDEVVGNGPPNVESAWLDTPSPVACAGSYFNSPPVSAGSCTATLHANVDVGSYDPDGGGPLPDTRSTANTDVKYGLVHGNTSVLGSTCLDGQNRPNCDMSASWTAAVTFPSGSARSAVAIRVRLKETTIDNPTGPDTVCGPTYSANCQWFFTAAGRTTNWQNNAAQLLAVFQNPVQRAFRGNLARSGSIKWLRLTSGNLVSGSCVAAAQDGPAASHPAGQERCFYIDMGLQGGLAKDQDEPPIALNLGDSSSQRAIVDCDPNSNTVKDEIEKGCGPFYSVNTFSTNPFCPSWNGINQFFAVPKAAPFDDWPPYRCIATQTGDANQIMQGFNKRLFGVNNNPNCPAENTTLVPGQPEPFTPGRNYWHDANNQLDGYTFAQDNPTPARGNRLRDDDPRLVTLFFTPYNSFSGTGNQIFPVVGFGNFYITGYGRTTGGGWQGGAPEDPCTDGNSGNWLDGLPFGVGNEPPPDLDLGPNDAWVWGHFVDDVKPNAATSGGTGIICNPGASFQPCVAVLVE